MQTIQFQDIRPMYVSRKRAVELLEPFRVGLPELREVSAGLRSFVTGFDFKCTKAERRWLRGIKYGAIVELVFLAVLLLPSIQMYFAPARVQASTVVGLSAPRTQISREVTNLMAGQLAHEKLQATASTDVLRKELTVPGVLVILRQEDAVGMARTASLQLFTYTDTLSAQAEAAALQEKFAGRRVGALVHVYVYDTLLGVYVGNDKNIIQSLDRAFGISGLAEPRL